MIWVRERTAKGHYIGWSYGLDGKLAKAPRYQDVEGFEKEKMGLYPIHVHVDHLGFVWVNLEAGSRPTVSWEEDFEGVDQQPRLLGFDLSQYHFDHTWSMMGDYNWKTLADNYNEVYPSLLPFKLRPCLSPNYSKVRKDKRKRKLTMTSDINSAITVQRAIPA